MTLEELKAAFDAKFDAMSDEEVIAVLRSAGSDCELISSVETVADEDWMAEILGGAHDWEDYFSPRPCSDLCFVASNSSELALAA